MVIRDALPADAAAACDVLRRSIRELCAADHGGDPAVLDRWLANKTPEDVAAWIAQTTGAVLVAEEGGAILAVGAVTGAGDIRLNYVAPEARFRGVSRAMLRALEERVRARGAARCTLKSTETARRFYRSAGYVEEGAPEKPCGLPPGYPMAKALAGPDATR